MCEAEVRRGEERLHSGPKLHNLVPRVLERERVSLGKHPTNHGTLMGDFYSFLFRNALK